MRIALDARMIFYSGIGRYIQNLIEQLSSENGDFRFSVLTQGGNASGAPPGGGNIEYLMLKRSAPAYSLREQSLLPIEMRGVKADLIHYPSFNMPVLGPAPFVVTIHDLIYYLFPGMCPGLIGSLYAKVMMRVAARLSEKIITPSEHSRREIVKHLGVSPSKVSVIHNGVSDVYRPVTDPCKLSDVRTRYKIDGDYILYVGNHKRHKNLENLVLAYAILRNREKFGLVIAGRRDPENGVYRLARELGLRGSVTFTGEVPEGDLPALYTMATLFVFPSLYEGFGLPPLEAMACGTPVVTSNTTSLPEVVGDSALTVNPLDVKELAKNMDKVLSSTVLQGELKDRGLRRAGDFGWAETARKTLEVYREAIGGN